MATTAKTTSPGHAALSARLDAHLATLHLPHGPTRYVAGALLSQTEQRHQAALLVYAALLRAPVGADANRLGKSATVGHGRAALALEDLVAVGAAQRVEPGGAVYVATPVGPALVRGR